MCKQKFFLTIVIVLGCVGSVFAFRMIRPHAGFLLNQRIAERSLGNEKSPIWITEYIDYQCPPCAAASRSIKAIREKYPDRFYLQVRYYPLAAHKNAFKAAVYAECASRQKGKFWKFHEKLFEKQMEWGPEPYPEARFTSCAEEAGLDTKRLGICVEDPEAEKRVREERDEGSELGVQLTPTFFVNGKIAVGVNALKEALRALGTDVS